MKRFYIMDMYCLKRTLKPGEYLFKVSYWRHDEEPSESVDYTMPFVELVTDLILGELILQ